MANKQTPQQWRRTREIAALYRGGDTMQDIADRYGISKQRVAVIIRDRTGIAARSRGYRKARAA